MAASDWPDAVLRSYHPRHDQFKKLQAAYEALRLAGKAPAAATVPSSGPLLYPNFRHGDVLALRARLGVPAISGMDDVYDAKLAAAVKSFQNGAGLSADGLVGAATRAALNAQPKSNLETLRANMEQWRWMPEDLGDTHLFVNIPEFKIRLISGNATALEERVITGKADTQTPIFSKALSTIVLRPTWQMPDSIKLEKILAAFRKGTSLEDQGYVIKKGSKTVDSSDIDWSTADLSHYQIFQPSGDGNALGDVKFLFPNKHSVYLHDTPMKALFNEETRLFSHGCIRLRNPLRMAQTLIDRDKGKGRLNVEALVDDGPDVNEVKLDRPVPIHVAYFTAWADDDNTVRTFSDPYGHEQRIRHALEQKWNLIDKGVDHLAQVDTWELKTVRIDQRAKPKPIQQAKTRRFDPPMGVTVSGTTSIKSYKWKSDGGVGDIMRNALMNN
jgi:L,D-transpeptidase YcbB